MDDRAPLADRLADDASRSVWQRLRRSLGVVLELCRFPAVFTALADPLLGLAIGFAVVLPLANQDATIDEIWSELMSSFVIACVVLASGSAYLFGMVLNDIVDRERDAIERPTRPIPSGRIGPAMAKLLAAGLAAAAITLSLPLHYFVGHFAPAVVVVLLLATIVAYTYAKNVPTLQRIGVGPALMGSCRALNVLVGTSLLWVWTTTTLFNPSGWWDVAPIFHVPVLLATYVAGITVFASSEAIGGRRQPLVVGTGLVAIAFVGFAAVIATTDGEPGSVSQRVLLWPALGLLATWIAIPLVRAIRDPQPAKIGPAIGRMIVAIIPLDAVMACAYVGSSFYVSLIAALIVPAVLMKRFRIT